MNIRITNQLNMVGTCLTTANNPDYLPVWRGQEPSSFGSDLDLLRTNYDAAIGKAKLANSADGGAADSKALAETELENATYVLARALSIHLKKKGDFTQRALVDLTHSEVVRLRENDLVTKATTIRDIGVSELPDKDAGANGVNAARVDALTQAITVFKKEMSSPRGQIVNRSTLLRELETDTAGLLERLRDLDDLVLQFDGTPAGERFMEAWKKARTIVDRGGAPTSKTPASTKPVPATAGAA